MTQFLILFFCFFLLLGYGQTTQKIYNRQASRALNNFQESIGDSADIYISRLNCTSAIVTTTYVQQLSLNATGQKLVELKDKGLNGKLLSQLNDTSKALAIQIILTKRLEISKSGLGEEYVYDRDYKHIVRVNFSYNNFRWSYIENNSDCLLHIDKEEIKKAKLYWSKKLKNSKFDK